MSDRNFSTTPPLIPVGVGFLVALGVVQGVFSVLIGLFVFLDRSDEVLQAHTALSSTQLGAIGVGAVIGGMIHVSLSLALKAGNQAVRLLFGVVALLNVSVAFWGVVGTHAEQRFTAAVSMVIGLMVLWLLFGNQRSIEFFERSTPPEY